MASGDIQAGRLVMVDIAGRTLRGTEVDHLRRLGVRAVCLFRKNLGGEAESKALVGELREQLGRDALIAVDQEGGAVVRATFLPQAPSAMALGAAGDEALAQAVGAAVARGLASLGLNWNFAPVVDVNANPANPVIGERSFGADPAGVARLAGAWLRGAMSAGVAGCLKHFPGHGDTLEDSHHALPCVDKSLAELQTVDLFPFSALAGLTPAVMSAHIVYPQLDPDRPATLSPVLLQGLLRGSLGYDGVVITDALMMKAVHERWGPARAAVMALAAGADMPLAQGTPAEQTSVVAAIAAAHADGTLQAESLRRSAARLDALAQRFPAQPRPYSAAERADDEALMRLAWARALCTLGDARPPALAQPLRVITQAEVPSDGVSEAGPTAAQVRALFAGFTDVECITVPDLCAVGPQALGDTRRLRVLVGNHRGRYSQRLTPDLHLALWNPYQVADIAAPAVVTWGHAEGALAALQAWLHGRGTAPGTPPIDLQPARPGAAA